MDEQAIQKYGKMISELITKYMMVIKCATDNCKTEINKAGTDKKLLEKVKKFSLEQNKPAKLKMLFELSNNNNMYNINKCAINKCTSAINDFITVFKSYLELMPKTNPSYNKLQEVITIIESMITSTNLTKRQYNLNIRKINTIISTLN